LIVGSINRGKIIGADLDYAAQVVISIIRFRTRIRDIEPKNRPMDRQHRAICGRDHNWGLWERIKPNCAVFPCFNSGRATLDTQLLHKRVAVNYGSVKHFNATTTSAAPFQHPIAAIRLNVAPHFEVRTLNQHSTTTAASKASSATAVRMNRPGNPYPVGCCNEV
jgi:hypothetical protein